MSLVFGKIDTNFQINIKKERGSMIPNEKNSPQETKLIQKVTIKGHRTFILGYPFI